MRVIVCGGCGVKNRVHALYLQRIPKCGNCGRLLLEPRAMRWARVVVKQKRNIVVAMSILAVAVAGGVLLFDKKHILEDVPHDTLAIALLILLVVFSVVAGAARSRQSLP
jgi:hypothetical protein